MDTPFMSAFAEQLGSRGWRVVRFEFDYMAARRKDGRKRPPSGQAALLLEWREVIGELGAERLVIGGKSLGGRIASMVADDCGARGLVCLGYPFHPPGRPEKLRSAHLAGLRTSCMIVQGTRDPFGTAEEAASYKLSDTIRFHWAQDGDHGLKPRKASGRTEAQNWQDAVAAIDAFLRDLQS